jgi:hypothetical protein
VAKQVRALQRLMLAHKLTLRYSAMYNPLQIVPVEKWDEETNANGASSGFGNEWLKFDAIGEMTSDGELSSASHTLLLAIPLLPRKSTPTS